MIPSRRTEASSEKLDRDREPICTQGKAQLSTRMVAVATNPISRHRRMQQAYDGRLRSGDGHCLGEINGQLGRVLYPEISAEVEAHVVGLDGVATDHDRHVVELASQ